MIHIPSSNCIRHIMSTKVAGLCLWQFKLSDNINDIIIN